MKTEINWFGPHLQELRNRAGLTQEGLSELAQVNPQTVKDWESGRKRPHLDRLPVLATVLGVGLERMLPPIAPTKPCLPRPAWKRAWPASSASCGGCWKTCRS